MPASSFVTRDHAGGAVDTAISSDINPTSLSITIDSSTGWPSGGASGPFYVIASYDVAGKEKIEVQSRTGNTLTIADTGKRGIDGTSAATHTTGAKIRHCFTALEADEANEHIANTALDHHTQYLTSARHAAINHTAAMIGADEIGSSEIAPLAVTSAELAANAVIAGKIATGGISTSAQFAAGVVDAAAIGADQVGTSEIAPLAVTAAEIANDTITATQIAANAIGSSELANNAVDTTAIADLAVTLAKFASEAGTDYDPNFDLHNVTLGTGGVQWGRYFKIGRLIFGIAGFGLGTSGGNVTGEIGFEIPFSAFDATPAHGSIAHSGWLGAATAGDQSPSQRYSGMGLLVTADNLFRAFATAGSSAVWDTNTPFDWTNSDTFQALFVYEATS